MALETLKGIKQIGGFNVTSSEKNGTDTHPIIVLQERNYIGFKIREKPIKEGGTGCQVSTLIEAAKLIIEGLNKKYPCRENAITITKLQEALMWQEERTKDRIARNAEGKSLP